MILVNGHMSMSKTRSTYLKKCRSQT